jgi:hypothetical protein
MTLAERLNVGRSLQIFGPNWSRRQLKDRAVLVPRGALRALWARQAREVVSPRSLRFQRLFHYCRLSHARASGARR